MKNHKLNFNTGKFLPIGILLLFLLILGLAAHSANDKPQSIPSESEAALSEEVEEETIPEVITGWSTDASDKTVYIQENGEKAIGWLQLEDGIYYLDRSGHPIHGTKTVNGKVHLFSENGRLLVKNDLLDAIDSASTTESLQPIGNFVWDSDLRSDVRDVINDITGSDGKGYNMGFVMIDIESGTGISYNADNLVYAASSIKGLYIPSVVSYREDVLDHYANSFQQIIMYSDNDLYHNARVNFGGEPFRIWCEQAHVDTSDPNLYSFFYPKYTPRIMAKLWIQNYYYFNTDELGKEISEWYQSPNQSAIYTTLGNADLNSGAVVTQSKAGWIAGSRYHYIATNDGGIIYDEHPYIICITSDIPSNMDKLNPLVEILDKVHQSMYP